MNDFGDSQPLINVYAKCSPELECSFPDSKCAQSAELKEVSDAMSSNEPLSDKAYNDAVKLDRTCRLFREISPTVISQGFSDS